MTTRERTEAASPLEKFEVLAEEIDRLRDELRRMRRGSSINDQLETVDLGELADQLDVPLPSLRRKITAAGGELFKVGKRTVIRKIRLVDVYETLERGPVEETQEVNS